jgi:DNA repair exonuclease SbcCD ATPase subunit
MMSEAPDVAETAGFLRRFADLMSTGYNATYLRRAADLLEALTARVTSASDEGGLWRFKYETATHQVELLETECGELKRDIEGHLDVTSSVLSERDAVRATLQARESELSELRASHDREREALQSTLATRGEELDQLRGVLEREREDYAAKSKARETEMQELRVAFDGERAELQVQLKVRTDELAALHIVSDREHDALRTKVASLEAKRVELRSAFDRIGSLRDQSIDHSAAANPPIPAMPRLEGPERDLAVGESNAVVPKTTLRQARAQFEYLAKEFIPLGDIASQVMCELGAYTMDLALTASQQSDHLPVGEVALSILAPSDPAPAAAADRM